MSVFCLYVRLSGGTGDGVGVGIDEGVDIGEGVDADDGVAGVVGPASGLLPISALVTGAHAARHAVHAKTIIMTMANIRVRRVIVPPVNKIVCSNF